MKINPKDKKHRKPEIPEAFDRVHLPPSRTDPEGWYTGIPENRKEKPVQDADDL